HRRLPLPSGTGFDLFLLRTQPLLFEHLVLEDLHSTGDHANFVALTPRRNRHAKVAFRHTLDDRRDPDHWLCDAAADEERNDATDDDDDQNDRRNQGQLTLQPRIAVGDLAIAQAVAAFREVFDELLDLREATFRIDNKHERCAGIAVGHVDDAL